MLYVCVRGVMDVAFSVCIVKRGAVGCCCSPAETYRRKGGDSNFQLEQLSVCRNYQFPHRRLESLEYLIVVLFPYITLVF